MKRIILILAMVSTALFMPAQLFWRVSGNGLEKDSYILGTAHNAPISMIDEISGLNDAIQNCDIAIGETNRNDTSDQDISMTDMMVPVDSTLDKLLSPEDFSIVEETVNKCLESMGVTINQLLMFKPGLISLLAMDINLSNIIDSNDNEVIFDLAILDRAAVAGHPTMGFETKAEHLQWILDPPLKDQATWLLSKCKNYDLQELMDDTYFNQGDVEKLESRTPDEGYREIFVYQRNSNWAEKLDQMMPEQSCLICVGVAHLSGEKGLLQLLRDRGYTVEPVQ